MKIRNLIVGTLALIAINSVHAAKPGWIEQLDYRAVDFPDESTAQGLAEAIPCVERVGRIRCTWMIERRVLEAYDKQSGEMRQYWNWVDGSCTEGVCWAGGIALGNNEREIDFTLSHWYYLGKSSDGRNVAYLYGFGPAFNKPSVTYNEAGQHLERFFKRSGIRKEHNHKFGFDNLYEGGWAAYQSQKSNATSNTSAVKVITNAADLKVIEAWCDNRLDDTCYVDGKRIPMKQLPTVMPVVDPAFIESLGGECERVMCFNSDYLVIGLNGKTYGGN